MDEIKIACIGCGGVAGGYGQEPGGHLNNLKKIEGVSVRGLVDINIEAARRRFTQFGGEYYTDDVQKVMKDTDVDAVLICTHHDSHASLIIQAAQASKHVFVEKPMAMTIEECEEIERVVKKAGIKLQVGFRLRFAPIVREVKKRIEHPLVIVGQVMESPWEDHLWAQHPVKGGGNVLSQGCHNFDLVCWLSGSQPESIFAHGGTLTHKDTDIIDNIVATIRFKNGSIGCVIQGDAGPSGYTSKFFFEVFGGDKTATLYDRCTKANLRGLDKERLIIDELSEADQVDPEGNLEELRAFIKMIREDLSSPCGVEDGKLATVLIHKAFESIATGKVQKI